MDPYSFKSTGSASYLFRLRKGDLESPRVANFPDDAISLSLYLERSIIRGDSTLVTRGTGTDYKPESTY